MADIEDTAPRHRRAMAAVYLSEDDVPFIVAQTPREVAETVRSALRDGEPLIEMTLANASNWNGKPLIARADRVTAISPPKDQDEDDV